VKKSSEEIVMGKEQRAMNKERSELLMLSVLYYFFLCVLCVFAPLREDFCKKYITNNIYKPK